MRWNATFISTLLLLGLIAGCRGGGALGGGGGDSSYMGPNPLYVQCHLKELKPGYVTWVNWTSSPSVIPAGTVVTLQSYSSTVASFVRQDTGATYRLDFGNGSSPDQSLQLIHKFIYQAPPSVDPGEFQSEIDQHIAKIGMNREQVYYSMGPPAWAGGNTNTMDRASIMTQPLWKYRRRKFGKDVGVEFDANGIVKRTEGFF